MGRKHHFYGPNVFLQLLAPENLEIDTKIIKFELIATKLRSLKGSGSHLRTPS